MHKYLVTAVLSAMVAGPVSAQTMHAGMSGPEWGAFLKTAAGSPPPENNAALDQALNAVFSAKDAKIIRDYYATLNEDNHEQDHKKGKNNKQGLPPGLAKRDHLPPGLQKHLERHGTLPPGLEKKRFPDTLDKKLSRVPKGYERIIVGNDAVLVDERTQVIVDILTDVLTGDL